MRSTSADVVVVGGGIIGCATAAHLASRGVRVTLLEKDSLAGAASGRNHGLIWYPQNPVLEPLYGASHSQYQELAAGTFLDIALDATPRGLLILVTLGEQWALAAAEAESSEAGGVKIERLEREALLEREPNLHPSHLGGWFIEDGYRLDPGALTLSFAIQAQDDGATILTYTEAKQVLVSGGAVTGVVTDQGLISCRTVVDAAGPWASKLSRSVGVELPIVPARGWLLMTKPIEPVATHLLVSPGWHLPAGEPGPPVASLGGYARGTEPRAPDVGLLIQQNSGGHVLIGGSRITSLRDDPEGEEATRQIAARAVAAVPALESVPIAGVWSGARPMSEDGVPLIGWLPQLEGFFVASGHGGQGIIMGGGSGRLAAEMITGSDPFTNPAPFDPSRFF